MMEANPAYGALLNGLCKRCGRSGCPVVGWVIELDEETVLRKESSVDGFCVLNVVHRKVVSLRLLLQPDPGRIDEGLVNATHFGDSDDLELRWSDLRCKAAGRQNQASHSEGETPKGGMLFKGHESGSLLAV